MRAKLSLALLTGLASVVFGADSRSASASCFLSDPTNPAKSCEIVNSNSGTLVTFGGFFDAGFKLGNVINISFSLNNEIAANAPYTVSQIQFSRNNGSTWYDYPTTAPANTVTINSTNPSVLSPDPINGPLVNPPVLPFSIDLRNPAYGGVGGAAANNAPANTISDGFKIRAYLPMLRDRSFNNPIITTGASLDYLILQASTYRYSPINPCRYPSTTNAAGNTCALDGTANQQTRRVDMIVPGPLPILGASVGFAFSRRLRRRISLANS